MRKILITLALVLAIGLIVWQFNLSPQKAATITVCVAIAATLLGGFDPKEKP